MSVKSYLIENIIITLYKRTNKRRITQKENKMFVLMIMAMGVIALSVLVLKALQAGSPEERAAWEQDRQSLGTATGTDAMNSRNKGYTYADRLAAEREKKAALYF